MHDTLSDFSLGLLLLIGVAFIAFAWIVLITTVTVPL